LTKVSLPQAEIDEAADFMLKIIEKHAGNGYRLFKTDLRKQKRVRTQELEKSLVIGPRG
jgi:hypothetical protein